VAANDWVIMRWKDAVAILFKTLTHHVPGGNDETRKNVSHIIVLVRIRTRSSKIQLYHKRYTYYLKLGATSRKAAGSISNEIVGVFHGLNPSVRTVALASTKPLTEISIRDPP
jgi:hypothetical protein